MRDVARSVNKRVQAKQPSIVSSHFSGGKNAAVEQQSAVATALETITNVLPTFASS